jgi:hypothetical protein
LPGWAWVFVFVFVFVLVLVFLGYIRGFRRKEKYFSPLSCETVLEVVAWFQRHETPGVPVTMLTLKVDTTLLTDAAYYKLTDGAKALFWSIHAASKPTMVADQSEIVKNECVKLAPPLRALMEAGLIFVVDNEIHPTGRLVKRELSTGRSKSWRVRQRAKMDLICKEDTHATPSPSPSPDAVVRSSPATAERSASAIRSLLISDGLSPELADELIGQRARHVALNKRTWNAIKIAAEAPGWGLERTVEKILERDWKHIEKSWLISISAVSLAAAGVPRQVPDGYVRNHRGQVIKRQTGVAL